MIFFVAKIRWKNEGVESKNKTLFWNHLFMNSLIFSFFYAIITKRRRKNGIGRRTGISFFILSVWVWVCIVNFLAFLSSFTKSFFLHLMLLRWLLISTIEQTGEDEKNASNLVNWVKYFEYWVHCYHEIGIYWEIRNNAECERSFWKKWSIFVPSCHCFTWMFVKSRRNF